MFFFRQVAFLRFVWRLQVGTFWLHFFLRLVVSTGCALEHFIVGFILVAHQTLSELDVQLTASNARGNSEEMWPFFLAPNAYVLYAYF